MLHLNMGVMCNMLQKMTLAFSALGQSFDLILLGGVIFDLSMLPAYNDFGHRSAAFNCYQLSRFIE